MDLKSGGLQQKLMAEATIQSGVTQTDFFKPAYTVELNDSFIQQLSVAWHLQQHICLVSCDYHMLAFTLAKFSQLGIYFPAELNNAVPKRQAEFLAGRLVASYALRLMNAANSTVHIGKHRSPVWPSGFIGAISHSGSKVLCLLARSPQVKVIGVDLEYFISANTAQDIAESIHHKAEQQLLMAQGMSGAHATTLLFSAKESIFKALYPQVQDYFGFDCAVLITADVSAGLLTFQISPELSFLHQLQPVYQCFFWLTSNYLVTFLFETK